MESLTPPGRTHLKLSNDSYLILLHFKNSSERYYRDRSGWVKVSTRGRRFRATAEQVLNHLLPALAGVKPNVTVEVVYRPSATPGEDVGNC
jgi:hypothetical protein